MTANPDPALVAPAALDTAIGRGWLLEVRRYTLWLLALALIHTIASNASRSYCPGGVTGAGEYIDANQEITEQVPNCLALTLQPGAFVYLALAIGFVSSLTALARRGTVLVDARRQFNKSILLFAAVVVVWTAASIYSMFAFPIDLYDGGLARPDGFIFGNVDVEISPMNVQAPNPS